LRRLHRSYFGRPTTVLRKEISHICLPKCHGNSVYPNLNTCTHSLCLEVILRAEFPCTLSDCIARISDGCTVLTVYLLSSCKLSIRACFWAIVRPRFAFLTGLRFDGVRAGLDIFVGSIVGGAGNDATSRDVVDSVDLCFLVRVGAMLGI
jgi:hypothetical protein